MKYNPHQRSNMITVNYSCASILAALMQNKKVEKKNRFVAFISSFLQMLILLPQHMLIHIHDFLNIPELKAKNIQTAAADLKSRFGEFSDTSQNVHDTFIFFCYTSIVGTVRDLMFVSIQVS